MKGTYIWKKDDWSSSGLVANNHVAKSTHLLVTYIYWNPIIFYFN